MRRGEQQSVEESLIFFFKKKVANTEAKKQTQMHNSRQRTCWESQSVFAPLASCTCTLFFTQITASHILFYHCLQLYFHEKLVTDVMAYK